MFWMLRCSPADWTKKKEVKSSWEGNSDCETETDRNSLNGKRTELRCQAKCGKMSEKSSGSSESSATERQEGKWECERKAKMRMKRNGRGKERGGGGSGDGGRESREKGSDRKCLSDSVLCAARNPVVPTLCLFLFHSTKCETGSSSSITGRNSHRINTQFCHAYGSNWSLLV